MSVYLINGVAVNERVDWRHALVAGPVMGRREEGFPGDPSRYVVKGYELPPDLVVTGYLEAADIAALNAAFLAYARMRETLAMYTVSIHGDAYARLDLWSLEGGGLEPAGNKVRRAVRFVWRQTVAAS